MRSFFVDKICVSWDNFWDDFWDNFWDNFWDDFCILGFVLLGDFFTVVSHPSTTIWEKIFGTFSKHLHSDSNRRGVAG